MWRKRFRNKLAKRLADSFQAGLLPGTICSCATKAPRSLCGTVPCRCCRVHCWHTSLTCLMLPHIAAVRSRTSVARHLENLSRLSECCQGSRRELIHPKEHEKDSAYAFMVWRSSLRSYFYACPRHLFVSTAAAAPGWLVRFAAAARCARALGPPLLATRSLKGQKERVGRERGRGREGEREWWNQREAMGCMSCPIPQHALWPSIRLCRP